MRLLLATFGLLLAAPAQGQHSEPGYLVGVVSESADAATWFKPSGTTLVLDRVVPVGIMPSDIDGPHHITTAPDQQSYYITIAHGTPYGSLWKLSASGDSILGRAQVELFPTTISLTPNGQFAFVANSDFHGDHPRTNVISVIHTPTMNKITDIAACDMPHGVRVNHTGMRAYASCMHSDEILQIEVATLDIARRVKTGPVTTTATRHTDHAPAPLATCSPTYVSVSPDDRRLYVACNSRGTLQVWDAESLKLVKEIPVGKGAYNVEPTPDGKLVVVTNKKDQSVSLVNAATLRETARIPTRKKIVHGVAFSPDNRLAYISCESIGADPGSIDVIDLTSRRLVASVPVPGQPTGITILRTTRPS